MDNRRIIVFRYGLLTFVMLNFFDDSVNKSWVFRYCILFTMADIAASEATIHQLENQLADDIQKFKNMKPFTFWGTSDEELDVF